MKSIFVALFIVDIIPKLNIKFTKSQTLLFSSWSKRQRLKSTDSVIVCFAHHFLIICVSVDFQTMCCFPHYEAYKSDSKLYFSNVQFRFLQINFLFP